VSALSEVLVAANVENWSAREIARRGGDRVSHSQLGKYLKPSHPRPGEDVLQVFADVFKIPIRKLRELAGVPIGEEEPYDPPSEANRLSAHQRDVVSELIRMLAETKVGDGDDAGADRSAAPIGDPVTDLANRRRVREQVDAEAARDVGQEGSSGRRRRAQDKAGEPITDDPTDMEPR
jgi:transcriptional regulator with XRE-family HTH domain